MKRIITATIASIILFILSGIAQADGYDETKACIGPAVDMVDYYLGVYKPVTYYNSIQPITGVQNNGI